MYKHGENEKIDAAVQPNLTLDLKRKAIECLPEEVIQIIKRDVERCASSPPSMHYSNADRLVLAHNYISYLPYRFVECVTMQYLNLRGNRFLEFPKPASILRIQLKFELL